MHPPYVVAIVVEPSIGDRIGVLLGRMPVWLAGTEANRLTSEHIWASHRGMPHTDPGGLTIFSVDAVATAEDWLAGVLDSVAAHHDRYSHTPGYSAVEVVGVGMSERLQSVLAAYRLTAISRRRDGFIASTPDGTEAASPNDGDVPATP